MRITTLIIVLMTSMVITAHAQFHGHCGSFRYKIDGKRISTVALTPSSESDKIVVTTYYKVDVKNGYVWFWIEETEPGSNRISRYTTLWSRLSELNTDEFGDLQNSPANLLIRTKNSQQFFFSTVYTTQKKGPQYGVLNKLLIRFRNDQEASSFADELRQVAPKFK